LFPNVLDLLQFQRICYLALHYEFVIIFLVDVVKYIKI